MDVTEMRELVERHLKAEGAGDVEGAVAVYTDDVTHDAVGIPRLAATGQGCGPRLLPLPHRELPHRSGASRSTSSSPTTRSCSSRR